MIPKDPPIVTHTKRELRHIEEKAQQRKEMREYIIKERSNPFRAAASQGTGYIEDPAFVRYEAHYSMLSEYTYLRPTFKSFRLFMAIVIGPMIGIGLISEYNRRSFENQCRRGEISYAARKFKFV